MNRSEERKRRREELKDIVIEKKDLIVQEKMLADSERMEKIYKHLSSGGTIIDYCDISGQSYAELIFWINSDDSRKKKYEEGKLARQDWLFERVLKEYKALSMIDLADLYDENGALKPAKEWGALGAAIAGVESFEVTEMVDGEKVPVGTTKKVKLYDKTKTLDALGRYLKMFTDVLEVRGVISLKDALAEAEERSRVITAEYVNLEKEPEQEPI